MQNKQILQIVNLYSDRIVTVDFFSSREPSTRPLLILCPGGGYERRSLREQDPIVHEFSSEQLHCAILQYSVSPETFPLALTELASTIHFFVEHASAYDIDPSQIFLMGFSAGGHLALSYAVYRTNDSFWRSIEPGPAVTRYPLAGLLLAYPVVTSGKFAHNGSINNLLGQDTSGSPYTREQLSLEKQIHGGSALPPLFLWHTWTDQAVPVENSLLLVQAIRSHQADVPVEFHMYEDGEHGLALATEVTDTGDGSKINRRAARWVIGAKEWLQARMAK